MKLTSRILFARLILPLFITWSVIAPSQSYAFVAPAGVIPPPAFVAPGALSATAVAIGSLTVGAIVGYLLVGALFGDNNTDAVRLQLAAPTSAEPPIPTEPLPVPTAGFTVGGKTGLTPTSACYAIAASSFPKSSSCSYQVIMSEGSCYVHVNESQVVCDSDNMAFPSVAWVGYGVPIAGTVCPNGSTISGSTCVISNARLAACRACQELCYNHSH